MDVNLMKTGSTIILASIIITGNALGFSSGLNIDDDIEKAGVSNAAGMDIRVAVFTDEPEDEDFYGPYGRTVNFLRALENYSWQVDDREYVFRTFLLRSGDILKGDLTLENYDVFVYPPDTVNENLFTLGNKYSFKNTILKREINNFVEAGGGFFGTCSGSTALGDFNNKPTTLLEDLLKNSCLDISNVNVNFKQGFPIIGQLSSYDYKYPSYGGYVYFSGWNLSDYDINYHVGVSLDVVISRDNAIFDDYLDETRKIRWIGGPDLIIPDDSSGIQVIARFPEEEISDNESTRIHYWRYTGGVLGLMKAMIDGGEEIHWAEDYGILMNAVVYAEDWEMTDEIVETRFANKPFMTTEIFQNENQARIVRCTGHPEDNVWWGGHIEELEDDEDNNMYDGFHRWKDIIPENETAEEEFSYDFWLVRRSVAWAAKIPDDDLPLVYGESQVCDIDPYEQDAEEIIIYGNAETTMGDIYLDLDYRYSQDNSSWTDWILHNTDSDNSDGWFWEFDSPRGSGYYQFRSTRRVRYDGEWFNETNPPGPDAILKKI